MRQPVRSHPYLFSLLLAAVLLPARLLAEPASITLDYTCDMPWVGQEPVVLRVDADLPPNVPVDWRGENSTVEATVSVPSAYRGWLRFFGARTLDGRMHVYGGDSYGQGETSYILNLDLAETPIPSSTGDILANAPPQPFRLSHSPRFTANLDVHLKEMTLFLNAYNADGETLSGSLGQTSSDCVLAGEQDTYFHTIKPLHYSFSPTEADIGDVQSGLSRGTHVDLNNSSGEPVNVQQVTITGPQASLFSQTNECSVIAHARHCEFWIEGAPSSATGEITATLTVTMGDAEATTVSLPLKMNAVDRQYAELSLTPQDGNFGPTPLGLSVEKVLRLQRADEPRASSTGLLDLRIEGPDAGVFAIQSDCTELPGAYPADNECEIRINFQPGEQRQYHATLVIDPALDGVEGLTQPLAGEGTDNNTGYQTEMAFETIFPGPEEADGYAPSAGSLSASVSPGNPSFDGSIDFRPTLGDRYYFSNISYLVNTYQFEAESPLTGTLVDGTLSASVNASFRVPSTRNMVNLTFGNLPFTEFGDYGRESCRSAETITIEIESAPGETFSWQSGGKVQLSFVMPAITGCGYYAGLAHEAAEGQYVQQTVEVDLAVPGTN